MSDNATSYYEIPKSIDEALFKLNSARSEMDKSVIDAMTSATDDESMLRAAETHNRTCQQNLYTRLVLDAIEAQMKKDEAARKDAAELRRFNRFMMVCTATIVFCAAVQSAGLIFQIYQAVK